MLQIAVTAYFLLLWAGIVLGSQAPQSAGHLLALILVSALIMLPLAPRLARLLLRSLSLAAHAPPRISDAVQEASTRLPGAPGTPGAALARAPDLALALT